MPTNKEAVYTVSNKVLEYRGSYKTVSDTDAAEIPPVIGDAGESGSPIGLLLCITYS